MKCHDREKKRTGELAQLPKQINELESEHKQNTGLDDIFTAIFENISEGIIISDIDSRILHINKSIERISGYSRQELIGKNIDILNGEKEAKSIDKEIFDCMGRGERWCREIQQKRKDGSIYLADLEIFPIHTNGIPFRVSIQRDITKRILLQEALWESKNRYEALLSALPVGAILTSPDGKFFYTNEQTSKTLGLPSREINGLKWAKALHPEDKETVLTEWIRCIKNHEAFKMEYRFLRPDKEIVWVIGHAVPYFGRDNKLLYYVGTITDITERKQMEAALRNSEERFKTIFQQSPIGIELYDHEGKLIDVNNACLNIFGVSDIEEVKGFNLFEDPNLPAEAKEMVMKRQLTRYEYQFDFEIIKKLGLYKTSKSGNLHIDCLITPIKEVNLPQGLLVQVQDISERKITEEALLNSERFLSNTFGSIQDYLSVIDTEFNIIRVNPTIEEKYFHKMPLIGKKCYNIYHGRDQVCQGCPGVITLKSGETARATVPSTDSGGNTIGWLELHCYPFLDASKGKLKGVIIYARDITEKIETEKEMARLERLNLVGEMAASIGHEIRNPMTAVRGFLQMLGRKQDCSKYHDFFKIMIDELDRANSIITEFLSLAKNKQADLKIVNLNTILDAIMPLILANANNFKINTLVELGDIPDLLINEKEIRQLILNLSSNGSEAMDSNGTLTIKTFMDGEDVVLSVQDQGQGIDPALYDKIGTPFLTTKEEGTGLGLAVCYGIAARHNAAIRFESGPAGTTFFVKFKRPQN